MEGWKRPGEPLWLIGERRADGREQFYLSNLPATATLRELATHLGRGGKIRHLPGGPPAPSLPAVRRALLAAMLADLSRRCSLDRDGARVDEHIAQHLERNCLSSTKYLSDRATCE